MEKGDCMPEEKEQYIEGWELGTPDPGAFEVHVLEVQGECRGCHLYAEDKCHTPEESFRRLVPRYGRVEEIGRLESPEGHEVVYYAWINGQQVSYVELLVPRHRWAKASFIPKEKIPLGILPAAAPLPFEASKAVEEAAETTTKPKSDGHRAA
jgi:hypothetical protein